MSPLDMVPREKPVNSPQAADGHMHGEKESSPAYSWPLFWQLSAVLLSHCPSRNREEGPDSSTRGYRYTGRTMPCLCQQALSFLFRFFRRKVSRKTGNWYKTHMIVEVTGGACIIARPGYRDIRLGFPVYRTSAISMRFWEWQQESW